MESEHAIHLLARLCHVRAVCRIISVWSQFNWPYLKLHFNISILDMLGARGNVVIKALCYKPEGRGFESR
jgi:hypothetical protein